MAEKKGKLAEIKTKETSASVEDFISNLEDESKRKDSFLVLEMMKKSAGEEPKMWGNALIGFGNKRYKSPKTGREVDWFKIGFSPRKANLSLHLMINHQEHAEMLTQLGKYKTSGGCIYVNKLADVNLHVLQSLIETSLSPDKEQFF